MEKLHHGPTPHCRSLQKERMRDEGDGEIPVMVALRRGSVQPSLDFGILQPRRASLKPGENVGRYDVGDEGGRTGLRS